MAMARALLVLPLLAFPGALSQSIKSCGGPTDHLSNVVISLSPDPIAKGQPFTIEVSGDLDEGLTDTISNVNLTIQALGIIKASVSGGAPLSLSPGASSGPMKITIGPISIPSGIPGYAVVEGQVHVTNAKSEPVFCLDMDLHVPAMEEVSQLQVAAPPLQDISSCGQATDHMPDFSITTSAGVMTATGTLDEAVSNLSVDLDVTLKVLILSVPLKMTIPIGYAPGMPKGAVKITAGPSTVVMKPDITATLKGTMKMNDANGEQITCLNIDTVVGDAGGSEPITV